MNLKTREIDGKDSWKGSTPATGHSPRILSPTAFTIDFLRFQVHFSFSVWVLGKGSLSNQYCNQQHKRNLSQPFIADGAGVPFFATQTKKELNTPPCFPNSINKKKRVKQTKMSRMK